MELMAESFLPRHAILYVERLIHSCGPFLKRSDVLLMYCIKKGGGGKVRRLVCKNLIKI